MNDIKAKIYYIYNSCTAVETENYFMVFDYFKTPQNEVEFDFNFDDWLNTKLSMKKNIFVFVSHKHPDHYNKKIFDWLNINKNIRYIISDDVVIKNIENIKELNNIHFVKEKDEKVIDGLNLKMYGSTDAGVSFMVDADDIFVFHAGDLNWWYWKDDTEDEAKFMENSYKNVISDIEKMDRVDIAFFPVDSRLEDYYYLGGEYFIEKLHPSLFIPMHFSNDFNITKKFKEKIQIKNTEIFEIKHFNSNIL